MTHAERMREFRKAEAVIIRYNRDCNERFLGRGGKADARRRRLQRAADEARRRILEIAENVMNGQ